VIIKPYEHEEPKDPRLRAGVEAERQMARYLDRYFRDSDRFLVLHDLRLEHEGDRAQIDHLVVHPFGVAIVESKSVSTAVKINALGEWERLWQGKWVGMPDPLLQAERQGLLLRRLLHAHQAELLDRLLGRFTTTFTHMALDVFAAVSDKGKIVRAKASQAPRALKADAVPKAIEAEVERYRRASNPLKGDLRAFVNAPRDFSKGERQRIARFLHARHRALNDPLMDECADPVSETIGSDVEPPVDVTPNSRVRDVAVSCRHCGGHRLEGRIGKYGPYASCQDCGRNTKLQETCTGCGTRYFLEREGAGFAGTCKKCGSRVRLTLG
jgi:hypothetical protein